MTSLLIVFDRDGTLIEHVPYLSDPDSVRILPGVIEGIDRLLSCGHMLALHTNQSGVGRGLFPVEAVHACNERMIELLNQQRQIFSEICVAPESPDEPAVYRKPSPRFANELMAQYGVTRDSLVYVGDRGIDLLTAKNAGVHGIGVATGLEDLWREVEDLKLNNLFPVVNNFSEVVHRLTEYKRRAASRNIDKLK